MGWVRSSSEDEVYDHEGYALACGADGVELEPTPQMRASSWFYFDGRQGRPQAHLLVGACACGWRGSEGYPIDWDDQEASEGNDISLPSPYRDWDRHVDQVLERLHARRVPADVENALSVVERGLRDLVTTRPLIAARVARQLEGMGDRWLDTSVRTAKSTGASWAEVGEALGTSKQNAHERFRRLVVEAAPTRHTGGVGEERL